MLEKPIGIVVRGAREHNLKNVSLEIPRNRITVITGLSGSGKSSLAFDTIYAEGQRRYIESLSAYARNFLEQLKKPDADSITGLSPAIAIDQKSISANPRSTVGTVTEIYDYMRLLYARVGTPHCPQHHIPVASQTPQQIVDEIFKLPQGTVVSILSPVAQGKKGEFLAEFQTWQKKGFLRARIDGEWTELEKAKRLARHKSHDIDLLIDRLTVEEKFLKRFRESVNTALTMAKGFVAIEAKGVSRRQFSIYAACPECGFSFPELEPRLFSFNNPRGACPTCHGLGTTDIEEHKASEEERGDQARTYRAPTYTWKRGLEATDEEGESVVDEYAVGVCPDCHGSRLRSEARNVTLNGKNIAQLADFSAEELREFVKSQDWKYREAIVAEKIIQQILFRLDYMCRVGTGYLSLSRPVRTLSGGEAQRIRLATQMGSALVGVLYVLDEPSIGLHPRDHHRLLEILKEIRNRGNTVLMVEHDEDTIRCADHIVDLGPRAGKLGGEVMASGSLAEILESPSSITGLYLSHKKQIQKPAKRRNGTGALLSLTGASGNNLKNVSMDLPLGTFIGVTGVSGSGKSTLIIDTLYRKLAQHFYKSSLTPAPFKAVSGLENLDKVIEINQKPIGRTPRSIPATYVGLFPLIRDLYSQIPEAKIRGYKPGHFSFNVKGGRCEVCQGGGQVSVEMHFLSDVYVQCDTCLGRRYSREILAVKYRGKSIADVLEMNVGEALEFFKNHKLIHRKLETLHMVGLDYMTLGQSSTTLSGGEAQRVKLSKELSKRATGKTLYILDEPTTGLHFEDIRQLLELLQLLVDQGNTVLVIEHNMDVIKNCDYVLDLGPEGGRAGGEILARGTPEEIARHPQSITGKFLAPYV